MLPEFDRLDKLESSDGRTGGETTDGDDTTGDGNSED
jgi:hypothetical protein